MVPLVSALIILVGTVSSALRVFGSKYSECGEYEEYRTQNTPRTVSTNNIQVKTLVGMVNTSINSKSIQVNIRMGMVSTENTDLEIFRVR